MDIIRLTFWWIPGYHATRGTGCIQGFGRLAYIFSLALPNTIRDAAQVLSHTTVQ